MTPSFTDAIDAALNKAFANGFSPATTCGHTSAGLFIAVELCAAGGASDGGLEVPTASGAATVGASLMTSLAGGRGMEPVA